MAGKITTLTKPLRRRVGDLVVTLDPEHGVGIRRIKMRATCWISLSELAAVLDKVSDHRPTAFARPAPRDWLPRRGDQVFVRGRRPARARVLMVRNSVFEPQFTVRFLDAWGKKIRDEEVLLSETRPCYDGSTEKE